ncbi:MAG: DNA primase [Bacillota bacterium]
MGLIPTDIIEDVRIQTDIVSLVGEYVRLEKKGRNYTGSCPFHQERDPSFTVSPEKRMFYCFGCQAGGGAIKFLMMIENLTFSESVRRLASRAGIFIPEPDKNRDDKKAAREERAWKTNSQAAEFFHDYLLMSHEAAPAREYLSGRGLTPETIAEFKIGCAPAAWDSLVQHMKRQGCHPREIVEAGLAVENKNRIFDRFRNRIIFPVADSQGRMVAFGGRVLGPAGKQPKYLNTPETPYFNKGRILYGLHLARSAIKQTGHAVIMEGYMDVVTAHQFGVKNAIASMGTSLTPDQGRLLLRYTRDIYISYDADSAGMRAASRGLDILQQIGCRVRVISMPRDTDPDEFIRKNGAQAWQSLVDRSESLLEYKIRLAQGGKRDVPGILEDVLPNLAEMKSEIELEEGVKTVASRLSISWEAVRGEIRRYKASQRKIWAKPDKIAKNMHNIIKSGKSEDALARAELGILKIIVEKPEMLVFFRSVLGDEFIQDHRLNELYHAVARQIDSGVFEPARLLDELDDSSAALLSRVMVEGEDPEWTEEPAGYDRDKIAGDYIEVIKRNRQSRKRMMLMQELALAEKNNDIVLVNDILKKLQEINS